MKPQSLLLLAFLIILLHFQPIKAENPIVGTWELQHLDYIDSFLCCPFNPMTVKDNSKTDSLFGRSENFKAAFDFLSDVHKKCHHLIRPTGSDGLLIFKSYGSPNQTQTVFRYYDGNLDIYSYEIYFTLRDELQTLFEEYARNWTTKGKVCEYTMIRKKPSRFPCFQLSYLTKLAAKSSSTNFFKFLPFLIIIIMGVFFIFRKNISRVFKNSKIL